MIIELNQDDIVTALCKVYGKKEGLFGVNTTWWKTKDGRLNIKLEMVDPIEGLPVVHMNGDGRVSLPELCLKSVHGSPCHMPNGHLGRPCWPAPVGS